jgi:hypothetical protein
MIHNYLFDKILIYPFSLKANKLLIVSGYATSAMVFKHLDHFRKVDSEHGINKFQTHLIVGMCPKDGLSIGNHRGFQELAKNEFPNSFQCKYIAQGPPVHSKLYIWIKDDMPFCAFTGSANYTQTAFFSPQKEILAPCDPSQAFQYFRSLYPDTICCTDKDTKNLINLFENPYRIPKNYRPKKTLEEEFLHWEKLSLPCIKVPLVDKKGNVQNTAGLNWGFRQRDNNRNKNEAYIQLRPEVYNSDFFPVRSIRFTVHTDDDKVLICTRAQKDHKGHAIETPHNNSILGKYFRERLGLEDGAFVQKEDLERYGRDHVDFYKIDDENYKLDFSVKNKDK